MSSLSIQNIFRVRAKPDPKKRRAQFPMRDENILLEFSNMFGTPRFSQFQELLTYFLARDMDRVRVLHHISENQKIAIGRTCITDSERYFFEHMPRKLDAWHDIPTSALERISLVLCYLPWRVAQIMGYNASELDTFALTPAELALIKLAPPPVVLKRQNINFWVDASEQTRDVRQKTSDMYLRYTIFVHFLINSIPPNLTVAALRDAQNMLWDASKDATQRASVASALFSRGQYFDPMLTSRIAQMQGVLAGQSDLQVLNMNNAHVFLFPCVYPGAVANSTFGTRVELVADLYGLHMYTTNFSTVRKIAIENAVATAAYNTVGKIFEKMGDTSDARFFYKSSFPLLDSSNFAFVEKYVANLQSLSSPGVPARLDGIVRSLGTTGNTQKHRECVAELYSRGLVYSFDSLRDVPQRA